MHFFTSFGAVQSEDEGLLKEKKTKSPPSRKQPREEWGTRFAVLIARCSLRCCSSPRMRLADYRARPRHGVRRTRGC